MSRDWEIEGCREVTRGCLAINGVDAVQLVRRYGSPLFVFSESRIRSNILSTVRIPAGHDYSRLHDLMKARGFILYSDAATIQAGLFRIATLGAITRSDVDAFLVALREVLQEVR